MARIPFRLHIIGISTAWRTGQPGFGLRARSSITRPKFSAGEDEEALEEGLTPFLSSSGGRWALSPTGEGLERTFKFKTFPKTWVSLRGGVLFVFFSIPFYVLALALLVPQIRNCVSWLTSRPRTS